MKRNRTVLTLITGLLLAGSQAFGLSVNFDNVTIPGTVNPLLAANNAVVGNALAPNTIMSASPGQLPPGTTGTGTGSGGINGVNVRNSTNNINNGTNATPGLKFIDPVNVPPAPPAPAFPVSAGNNFLVVGDVDGYTNRDPWVGVSTFTLPVDIQTITADTVTIDFDWAFSGIDNTGDQNYFRVFLTAGLVSFDLIPNLYSGLGTTTLLGHFNKTVTLSTHQLNTPTLSIVFQTTETNANATNNQGVQSDVALGVDNINIVSAVPEPSTFILLGAGLTSLVFLRRRRV